MAKITFSLPPMTLPIMQPVIGALRGRGDPSALDERRVAIIGTREPSDESLEIAWRISTQAVQHGVCVVSGLALGIDTAAHQAALEAQGRTIAVLANGLLSGVYPAANRGLAERIVQQGGLLISELADDARPDKNAFVLRDRIQAALCDAVIVIEAGISSGTLHTARYAAAAGIPVYVVVPRNSDARYAGNAALLAGNWLPAGYSRVALPDGLPAPQSLANRAAVEQLLANH